MVTNKLSLNYTYKKIAKKLIKLQANRYNLLLNITLNLNRNKTIKKTFLALKNLE